MQLELAARLYRCHIDTRRAQVPLMLCSGIVEECANVPVLAQSCTCKMNWFLCSAHRNPLLMLRR
jgi:hypothetical protein